MRERAQRLNETREGDVGVQCAQSDEEKKSTTLFMVEVITDIRCIHLIPAVCCTWSHFVLADVSSLCFLSTIFFSPSNTYFKSILPNETSLEKKKNSRDKKRAWCCNYTPSLRLLIHPLKRAKDVERWIISPRYNLTVTLRCHLLQRTALLMSPTLHVSHFPAN